MLRAPRVLGGNLPPHRTKVFAPPRRARPSLKTPPGAWVGEVVMTQEYTPLLRAAQARQCHIQRGTDMLFEMIPAYLRFFDLPVATPEQLRTLAEIRY